MLINKQSIRFIKKFKFSVILYLIIIAITIPIETIGYSHYISEITTSVKGKYFDPKNIYKCIIFIIAIYLGTRILYALKYIVGIILGDNLTYFVRTNIFNDVLDKFKNNFDQIEKGKIISFLTVIPSVYEEKLDSLLTKIIPDLIGIIGLSLFFFIIDIKLGFIIWLMIISLLVTVFIVSKRCIKYKLEKLEEYHNNNEKVQDKLSNIFSILTTNNIDYELNNNKKFEKEYLKKKMKSSFQDLRADNIMVCTMIVFTTIILLYFIKLFRIYKNKKLVITGFLVFFTFIGYIDDIKWYIIDYLNKFSMIKQYEDQIISKKNNIIDGKDKDFIKTGNIEFKNIYFSYNNKVIILKNISCHFKPNKLNVIMGSSGSGKSTIFKLLLKLISPNSGEIIIDNYNINNANIEYLRKNIGIVNQNTILFNDSIYKNIAYNNNSSMEKVNQLIKKLKLDNSIFKNLNLNTNVGVEGYYLSNGQRQMILILREYLNNKPIILMDEPTSSLDMESKKKTLEIIKNISQTKNIILSSHDSIVKNYADYIYKI